MARIAGVNLPNKPTWIALTYIHGIGRTSAKKFAKRRVLTLLPGLIALPTMSWGK